MTVALISRSDVQKHVEIAAHLADAYGRTGTIEKVTRYGVHIRLENDRVERFPFQGRSVGAVGWQSNLTVHG